MNMGETIVLIFLTAHTIVLKDNVSTIVEAKITKEPIL